GSTYVHSSLKNAATIAAGILRDPSSGWIFRKMTTIDIVDVSLNGQYGYLAFENLSALPWMPELYGSSDITCSGFAISNFIYLQNNYTGNIKINGNLTANGVLINGFGKQRFTFTGVSCQLNASVASNISAFYDSLTIATGAAL